MNNLRFPGRRPILTNGLCQPTPVDFPNPAHLRLLSNTFWTSGRLNWPIVMPARI
jgi:hypothetical protein